MNVGSADSGTITSNKRLACRMERGSPFRGLVVQICMCDSTLVSGGALPPGSLLVDALPLGSLLIDALPLGGSQVAAFPLGSLLIDIGNNRLPNNILEKRKVV
ncbi:hypothetical protein C8R44DRAFT_179258 [Mycena epipterygia]|nr:hypothetical protein C8R44DRAFT_179258 [Mycena epipterygia]